MTDTTSRRATSAPPQQTGWIGMVVFAGVMLLMVGGFQIVEALVALFKDEFYVTTASGLVVNMDYTAWGWTHLILGLVMVAAGLGVLVGKTWARAVGVVIASLSALANLAFLPAYPVWSTIVIALDVLVIYALTAHGREVRY